MNNMNFMISAMHIMHNFRTKLPENGTKYLLSWNPNYLIFPNGDSIFPALNCTVNNCEFHKNRHILNADYQNFDAILFSYQDLVSKEKPLKRTRSQLYIFTTIESSYNYPACEEFNNNFFNWTFTYRLDSTIPWTSFSVRNITGNVIAPSKDVVWQTNSDPVKKEIVAFLARKTKAAAWLVNNCKADKVVYLKELQQNLSIFSLKIDVYGKCTQKKCTNENCEEMIKNDYFFYISFENSISDDYVTENVLHGYNNMAVPIVYGGADYSRFLPPGSYINAREMDPYILAFTISEAVKNPGLLQAYFTWSNLYSVQSDWAPGLSASYRPLCDLCEPLNEERKTSLAIADFRVWWNGINGMKKCLSEVI